MWFESASAAVAATPLGVAASQRRSSNSESCPTAPLRAVEFTPLRAASTGVGIPDAHHRRGESATNPFGRPLPQNVPASAPWPGSDPLPPPAGMQWQDYWGIALPYSTSDGPVTVSGALIHGFSRTAQGAALAGQHIAGRHLYGGRDARRAVAAAQTCAADATMWSRYLAAADRRSCAGTAPTPPVRPDAFRVLDYTADCAVIAYAIPMTGTGADRVRLWTRTCTQLSWRDDQWKLCVTQTEPAPAALASLWGWTRW